MLPEVLEIQAARYVSGELAAPEREALEVILGFHEELRASVNRLQQVVAAVMLTDLPTMAAPPDLKERLLARLPDKPEPEALVATDAAGRVEWVNTAFTAMCGYTLAELRGRKPGELLQGPDTDTAAVARIRTALRGRQPCRETLMNYHKDGRTYRANIHIAPVLDDGGEPLWFVARERKLV